MKNTIAGLIIALFTIAFTSAKAQCPVIFSNGLGCSVKIKVDVYKSNGVGCTIFCTSFTSIIPAGTFLNLGCGGCSGCGAQVTVLDIGGTAVTAPPVDNMGGTPSYTFPGGTPCSAIKVYWEPTSSVFKIN